MMLLSFILVLTMSVAAQSADHVPHDSNYYCGDNIAEFGKAFVEYCSPLREKRKVLEEYGMIARRVDFTVQHHHHHHHHHRHYGHHHLHHHRRQYHYCNSCTTPVTTPIV